MTKKMGNDLAKLYRELRNEKSTPELNKIRKNIEDKISDKLREHFIGLLEIGDAIGYSKFETELKKATELVGKLKKSK